MYMYIYLTHIYTSGRDAFVRVPYRHSVRVPFEHLAASGEGEEEREGRKEGGGEGGGEGGEGGGEGGEDHEGRSVWGGGATVDRASTRTPSYRTPSYTHTEAATRARAHGVSASVPVDESAEKARQCEGVGVVACVEEALWEAVWVRWGAKSHLSACAQRHWWSALCRPVSYLYIFI